MRGAATLPVFLPAVLLLLSGCEPLVQVLPPAVTLHLSGPSESIGTWTEQSGARLLECSSLLTIQASGEGTATWADARVSWVDAERPTARILTSSELEGIFGTAVVDAGSEHAGQIYGQGTDTFRVDFVLTYETMVEEDPGPTRVAAYSYTCRVP
jgi:uncharacterized protein YceK